jgi:DNA-binding response OmpR family regulator
MAKILLVEDDALTAQQTSKWLAKMDGHTVETVDDGNEALARLKLYDYDLVILDWNIPGCAGVDVCNSIRSQGANLPVLMLTANAKIADKEVAFDCGADDYLTKPFDLKELSLRVRALMRRPANLRTDIMQVGSVKLDRSTKQVFKDGAQLQLTAREYALLELLMRHKDRPLSAEEIVNKAWSSESEVSQLTVKTVVSRLRAKLSHSGEESIVQNLPGRGYCVRDPKEN